MWHKTYYDNFKDKFYPLYKEFIVDFVKPTFEYDEIIYQKIPTFRVHQVDNLGVGEWHRDRIIIMELMKLTCGFLLLMPMELIQFGWNQKKVKKILKDMMCLTEKS